MKFPAFITRTRAIAALLILAIGGGYLYHRQSSQTDTSTRYTLGTVEKQTIITSVKGTGQVSGLREFKVSPDVSAKVTKVLVKVGDRVTAGTPLVDLDRKSALRTVRDAEQSVRDASLSLESAKLEFQKSQKSADELSVIQSKNSLAKAKRDLQDLQSGPTEYELKQAQADLDSAEARIRLSDDGSMPKTVRDEYDTFAVSLQGIAQNLDAYLSDTDSVLAIDSTVASLRYAKYISILDTSRKEAASQAYAQAKIAIKAASTAAKSLKTKNEDTVNIDAARILIDQALDISSTMLLRTSEALQQSLVASDFSQSELDGLKNKIDSDRSSVSSKIQSLLSSTQSIQKAKDDYESNRLSYQKTLNSFENTKAGATSAEIATAQERVNEAQAQLDSLLSKPDPIDLQLARNSLSQRESSLATAQHKLADAQEALNSYTVIAPFDGVIVALPLDVASDASPSSPVATLMTSQKVVTVPLNEVDASKVKNGQKATLTFDAIDGLSLTGEVILLDPIGTVSQGVVNYSVHVAFDAEDERIKSGMSASVSIITEVKADVLAVPNAAIKTQNETSYVETFNTSDIPAASSTSQFFTTKETPNRIIIQTGTANDEYTEITSGLKEGDRIVTQSIKPSATTGSATTRTTTGGAAAATGGNAIRIPGIGGGGGFGGR